jgi:hypothetical protein
MHRQKTGPRAEYRQQEGQRARDSASLADKFPLLKSLTLDLTYYDPAGVTKNGQIKYMVNLTNAKSVFRFDCVNLECIGGDFDLSEELANAVATRRTTATGKMCCQGWRNKAVIDNVHCHNILCYTINLGY